MSGNDATIVCEDCDLNQAIKGITFGTFVHSGQNCLRIKRVYVVKKIADRFIKGLAEEAQKLKLGKQITPLIREGARKKLHKAVKAAISKGCKLLLGGTVPKGPGFYYPPTILLVKNPSLDIMKYENFGPICPIHIVKDEEEAIKLANNSEYGLGGTIWTQDYKKGKEIAKRLETGTVWINDCNIPLVCGEYLQGWKNSSIPSSQERLMMFLKKRNIISFNSNKNREWWF